MNIPRNRGRWAGRSLVSVLAIAVLLALAPLAADAATVTGSWKAKIGSAGANGTATVQGYSSGSGAVVLKLAKLKAATLLPVTINKGICSSVGKVVLKLASIKITASGTASRTTNLSASQVSAIKAATAGTGKLAIRVGSGTTAKCGLFASVAIAGVPAVGATVTVGKNPVGVAIAPAGVWVTNWFDNTLSRIDPATNNVLQTLPLTIAGTGGPLAIAYGEGSLWVTVNNFDDQGNSVAGSVLRVDPTTGQQLATIPIGRSAVDIEVTPGAVWVPSRDDRVERIDPATNQVAATVSVPGRPLGVAAGFGALWVSTADGHLARIDPATNQVTATITAQDTGGMVAIGGNAVWMTNDSHSGASDGKVTRIDPVTNQVVASVTVGSGPLELAYGGGSLWVGLLDTATVVRVSATTNAILNTVNVGNPTRAIAATDHAVWAVHDLPAPDDSSPPPFGLVTRINY